MVTRHLGDKPTRRRPTRRQFISFECLFRIDRTKQVEQESRAIAGKPCNAAVNSNMGYYLKQVAGHANFLIQAPARKNDLE